MKIKRFALGVRFDTLKDSVSPEDVDSLLGELTSALSIKDVENLVISGGVCKLSEDDGEGIYTVVFTNGGLKKMRALYSKIDSDAALHAMLETRRPFIQNNVVRAFEGLELFGSVGKDGVCSGGNGRSLSFPKYNEARALCSGSKTVLIAPNAFKGTISADEASRRLRRAIRRVLPDVTCVPVPVADGGDGTLKAVEKALLGQKRSMSVTSPYGRKIESEYLVIDGSKAVIESALASGLAVCGEDRPDPLHASSFGTGQMILRAAHEGVGTILVCLGGSATNDCGLGLARALGVRFIASSGEEIDSAARMGEIVRIDASGLDGQVSKCEIVAVCDVSNPLTGKTGATRIFGPQKGADPSTVEELERSMLNMEKRLNEYAGKEICSKPGAGAAGGMGAMLMALFGAKVVPGAEAILGVADFDRKLRSAALVITGEGMIDRTSLNGKAVGAIIEHSHKAGVPLALIAGSRGEGGELVEEHANFIEYTGSMDDPLRRFDEAADRLAERIAVLFG
ncbi:MAG: glycerate kinase [Clostridia bacterium]|nr:glycerate kinase [Clostridia bacterium]